MIYSIDNNNIVLIDDILISQHYFIQGESPNIIFTHLLESIIKYTSSQYGFIGQMKYDDNIPYLETLAITNIAWTDKTYTDISNGSSVKFKNLNTLFGLCMLSQDIVISNDPYTDTRRGGKIALPPNHPPLSKFIGIPIKVDNKMIAMIGLANSINDYTLELVSNIEIFILNCSVMLSSYIRTESLKSALEERSKYMSMISHEIKTPLNAVIGYSQLIEIENTNENIAEYLTYIKQSGDNLLKLINDILKFNKNETININPSIFDVFTVVSSSLTSHCSISNKLNITISNNIPKNLQIFTDKDIFVKIINNLISNAVKYNYPSGSIVIDIEFVSNIAFFRISNTGNIIDPIYFTKIFNPFFRINENSTIGGNGLGLNIVKDLCDKLHIPISVSVLDSMNVFSIDISSIIYDHTKYNYNVLYIEDSLENIKLMNIIFQKKLPNYNLIVDQSGKDIISHLKSTTFDFILLDLHLPDITGQEIYQSLVDNLIKIPVVIVTADTTTDSSTFFIENNIPIIYKPIDISLFVDFIKSTFTPI